MDDYLKEALDIVKAQASVRSMTEEEITSMVRSLANSIRGAFEGTGVGDESANPALDPKKSIKEKSITCLECGKAFKILTKRHLSTHGLTPETYKEKHNMSKKASLVCKGLARERRKKMSDMRLWEKRGEKRAK
jgi:predicted transcriptional regulator